MNVNSYVVEFVGTLIFLFVILFLGNPIAIGVALVVVIYAFGNISGGHFNPAVSVMMLLKGSLSQTDTLFYVVSQVLGGATALQLNNLKFVKNLKKTIKL